MRFRKNDGFTLVELMVTILVSTLVAAAAATTILFGLRINKQSSQTQRQQSTTRILITALEDMVSQGSVGEVVTDFGAWELRAEKENPDDPNEEGKLLCYYRDGAICDANNNPIMDGILMSNAVLNAKRTLLTVDVETDEGIFTTSIRCRMPPKQSGEAAPEQTLDDLTGKAEAELASADTLENRMDFLELLLTHRDNKGWFIPNEDVTYTGPLYYSQWYIETAEGDEGKKKWENGDWNPDTPWCACFISWALNQQKDTLYIPRLEIIDEKTGKPLVDRVKNGVPYWFADVDEFMAYFQLLNKEKTDQQYWVPMRNNPSAPRPNPGDIIFFDTDLRDTDETTNHVGVVFHVEEATDTIYTIEGNSLGKVAIRQYSATNQTIIGYGVLPWIPNLDILLVGEWKVTDGPWKGTGKTMSFSEDQTGKCLNAGGNEVDCTWSYDDENNYFGITALGETSPQYIEIKVIENTLQLTWSGNTFTKLIESNPES